MNLADIIPIMLLVIGGLMTIVNFVKKNQKPIGKRQAAKPASPEQQTIQEIQEDIPDQNTVQMPERSTMNKNGRPIVRSKHRLTKKKVREAVIWMEVLGKPRSLNPYELRKTSKQAKK